MPSVHSDNSDCSESDSESDSTIEEANDADLDEANKIAKSESTAVFRLRFLVFLAMLFAAVGVSLAVYFLTANNENEEYHAQYDSSASKIITSFEEIDGHAISSLSIAATSYARSQPNTTWPFVTLNDFQQRAANVREFSKSLYVRIIPVISEEDRPAWEDYSAKNIGWLDEARAYQEAKGLGFRSLQEAEKSQDSSLDFSSGIGNKIYTIGPDGPLVDQGSGPYFPLWQESPHLGRDMTNFNVAYSPDYAAYIKKSVETGKVTIGGLNTAMPGNIDDPDLTTSFFAMLLSFAADKPVDYLGDPMSSFFVPVFDSFDTTKKPTALIVSVFSWATRLNGLLHDNTLGIVVVLENTCDGPFTYKVVGEEAEYMGRGDLHDPQFDGMERALDFASENDIFKASLHDPQFDGMERALHFGSENICAYSLRLYPSQELYDEYHTNHPIIITSMVALVFVITAGVFLLYSHRVERRQRIVLKQAMESAAIVSSLFPDAVRDRYVSRNNQNATSGKDRIKAFLVDGDDGGDDTPIADLFPHCTVFFADISGFTSWSTCRDPAQVFILLQTIYQAFDLIAKRRKVFKVETIGDSYVAVCGLPKTDEDHFISMARFATDCLAKFTELTNELEEKLGPGTAALGLRVGLNSGPVIAGVLRGERSRFQLFGDTVNTASRMESSGAPDRIQVSVATANLISGACKEHWVTRREEMVVAKGIGAVVTYWLVTKKKWGKPPSASTRQSASDNIEGSQQSFVSSGESTRSLEKVLPKAALMKHDRLISWSTDLLLGYIRTIATTNEAMAVNRDPPNMLVYNPLNGKTCLDEVVEVIKLPKFDAEACLTQMDFDTEIGSVVARQLREVVTTIANTYHDNPFHNFEHACHVTMSVEKFITRIVTRDIDEKDIIANPDKSAKGTASILHDYTHGINSDPLTLFAIVFSALIHDTDHRGVSNVQLCKEDESMAVLYRNKSVAEQNSLDIAWAVLMSEEFEELRVILFATRADLLRFRQVVVNIVLATDIFDKELNDLRKNRWDRAFGDDEVDQNLRATIVIEHIMQASDVSHTMQHWDVYRKWNYRLFVEMRTAYKQGRMGVDPSTFWYKGELGFFDNYIIPLAKKLKDCNIFGASSDECLTFALQNRQEWETRGEAIVASMTKKIPAASMKVLVAEDNAINQKLLLRILNRLGIDNVVVVDNGQKAVDREAAEPFDVVLMDMRMPVMDGVEACEIIMKRKGGHPIATVAFVTANASEEFKTECLKAGASDFVSKPFNIRDIERCLQKLQEAQNPGVETPPASARSA